MSGKLRSGTSDLRQPSIQAKLLVIIMWSLFLKKVYKLIFNFSISNKSP